MTYSRKAGIQHESSATNLTVELVILSSLNLSHFCNTLALKFGVKAARNFEKFKALAQFYTTLLSAGVL